MEHNDTPPPESANARVPPLGTVVELDTAGGQLIIRLPVIVPRESTSGATMILATTGGGVMTQATFQGRPIIVNVNAYFKSEAQLKAKSKSKRKA